MLGIRGSVDRLPTAHAGVFTPHVRPTPMRRRPATAGAAEKQLAGQGLQIIDSDTLAVLPPGFSREVAQPWLQTKLPEGNTTVGEKHGLQEATFLSFDPRFASILGDRPQLTVLAERDYEFAHEGPVYLPQSNEVFFTSNQLSDEGGQNPRIELYAVDIDSGAVRQIETTAPVPFANGAAAYKGGVALLAQCGDSNNGTLAVIGVGANADGSDKETPGGVMFLDPYSGDWHWLINNWFGLHFNSPNDIITTPDGALLFTDPSYGSSQGLKGPPQLGEYVWRYKPGGPPARVVADGFKRPNGLSISHDQKTVYVTDTGFEDGSPSEPNPADPHTVYAYDLVERNGGAFLANRRVFAVADTGIPDGTKTDLDGSVWCGCWDGLNVWAPDGSLIGKVMLDGGCSNFVFGGKTGNTLILLNEKRILKLEVQCQGGCGNASAGNSAE